MEDSTNTYNSERQNTVHDLRTRCRHAESESYDVPRCSGSRTTSRQSLRITSTLDQGRTSSALKTTTRTRSRLEREPAALAKETSNKVDAKSTDRIATDTHEMMMTMRDRRLKTDVEGGRYSQNNRASRKTSCSPNQLEENSKEEDISSSLLGLTPDMVIPPSFDISSPSDGGGGNGTHVTGPNCSILRKILLNRDVPSFYCTSDSPTGSSHSEDEDDYERRKLQSLPLPEIDSEERLIRRARSKRKSSISKEDAVSFKKRRFNEEEEEAKIKTGNRLDLVYGDKVRRYSCTTFSFFDSSSAVKSLERKPILHSLLTKTDDSELEIKENTDEMLISSTTTTTTGDNIITPTTRVVILKTTESSVNRKIGECLGEIAQLAARYRQLISLPSEDWVALVGDAVSRLLLLFMAERNFQFTVTPAVLREKEERPGKQEEEEEDEEEDELMSVEIPTVQLAEEIQRFIVKCQMMKVDKKEYHCMRLITLFHSGCRQGLEKPEVVEEVNSSVRMILQRLVQSSHPEEKLRYAELLLHLNSLIRLNGRRVQELFCRKNTHLRNFISQMVTSVRVRK